MFANAQQMCFLDKMAAYKKLILNVYEIIP